MIIEKVILYAQEQVLNYGITILKWVNTTQIPFENLVAFGRTILYAISFEGTFLELLVLHGLIKRF